MGERSKLAMALKKRVSSLDDVPEGLQELYTKKGDEYVLEIDGDEDLRARLDEFRENNRTLKRQADEAAATLRRFEGLDPDKVREMEERLRSIDESKLIDEGKIDEVVEQRVDRMRQDFESRTAAQAKALDEARAENTALSSRLQEVLIDSSVTSAVSAVGTVRKGAMQDILARARRVWQLQEGEPVPVGADGSTLYGKDGKAPMTFDEWAAGLTSEAAYLFEDSNGTGGKGRTEEGTGFRGTKTVLATDARAFGRNLEQIAKGEVRVVSE